MTWRQGNDHIIAITIKACVVCIDHYNFFAILDIIHNSAEASFSVNINWNTLALVT